MSVQFQKIFVINLGSRTDHRDSMSLAAALTNLRVDYISGVIDVNSKSIPQSTNEAKLDKGALGAWRAHLNIARL